MKNSRLLRSDVFWGLAVAALVVLQFWWLPGDKGTTTDSYSTTLDGKLGLYRTLTELFPKVSRDALQLHPAEPATLLLIAPDRYPNALEQSELFEFVYQGGTLLFAPNWSVPDVEMRALGIQLEANSFFQRTRPVATTPTGGVSPGTAPSTPGTQPIPATDNSPVAEVLPGAADPVQAEKPDDAASPPMPAGGSVAGGPAPAGTAGPAGGPMPPGPDELTAAERTISSLLVTGAIPWRTRSDLTPPEHLEYEVLVGSTNETGSAAEVATWRFGSGRVMVCSSPDVFSNRSLLTPYVRRLAVRLVEHLHSEHQTESGNNAAIVVNEFLNASDSYRQTGVLFSPALRIGTLQLMLLAVLTLWFGFHRFGPAIVRESTQRRSLTDSAMAVGNLQFRLQDGGAVVKNYLEYIRSQLRRRYGPAVQLEHIDSIAARSGMNAEEVRTQLAEAQRLANAPAVPPARTAATLRWLAELQNRLAKSPRA